MLPRGRTVGATPGGAGLASSGTYRRRFGLSPLGIAAGLRRVRRCPITFPRLPVQWWVAIELSSDVVGPREASHLLRTPLHIHLPDRPVPVGCVGVAEKPLVRLVIGASITDRHTVVAQSTRRLFWSIVRVADWPVAPRALPLGELLGDRSGDVFRPVFVIDALRSGALRTSAETSLRVCVNIIRSDISSSSYMTWPWASPVWDTPKSYAGWTGGLADQTTSSRRPQGGGVAPTRRAGRCGCVVMGAPQAGLGHLCQPRV